MKPKVYGRAYLEICQIKREEPGITAGEIIKILNDRGFQESEIPTRATIGQYKPEAGVQIELNLDADIKSAARAMYSKDVKISDITKTINARFNANYSSMAYRYWILGRNQQAPKTRTERDVFKQCTNLILEQEIHESEAMQWLEDHGVSEDNAFDWAMNRFCGGGAVVSRSTTPIHASTTIKGRSQRRKAA